MSKIHVELLTKAREIVASLPLSKRAFLCHAIRDAGVTLPAEVAADEIIKHINNLLDGKETLEVWLDGVHGINAYAETQEVQLKLRETRLAWIDWLIEEWKDAP